MAWLRGASTRWLALAWIALLSSTARGQKGEWVPISDPVTAQLKADGKKIGYPGLTAGVTVDPSNGDVYMVVCDQGLWKSTDAGKSFARVDGGKIGGRCETGYALDFDPAGKRLACFMIYGACASTTSPDLSPAFAAGLPFATSATTTWPEDERCSHAPAHAVLADLP